MTRIWKSSDPHTIQFLRATNRPARTGTSVNSKVCDSVSAAAVIGNHRRSYLDDLLGFV